jgi:hypothetical protein
MNLSMGHVILNDRESSYREVNALMPVNGCRISDDKLSIFGTRSTLSGKDRSIGIIDNRGAFFRRNASSY